MEAEAAGTARVGTRVAVTLEEVTPPELTLAGDRLEVARPADRHPAGKELGRNRPLAVANRAVGRSGEDQRQAILGKRSLETRHAKVLGVLRCKHKVAQKVGKQGSNAKRRLLRKSEIEVGSNERSDRFECRPLPRRSEHQYLYPSGVAWHMRARFSGHISAGVHVIGPNLATRSAFQAPRIVCGRRFVDPALHPLISRAYLRSGCLRRAQGLREFPSLRRYDAAGIADLGTDTQGSVAIYVVGSVVLRETSSIVNGANADTANESTDAIVSGPTTGTNDIDLRGLPGAVGWECNPSIAVSGLRQSSSPAFCTPAQASVCGSTSGRSRCAANSRGASRARTARS